jgi:FdhD protein
MVEGGHVSVGRRRIGRDGATDGTRSLALETPVALVHDGATTAVMMATPTDLEDFAVGFALTEGIVARVSDIQSLEVIAHETGAEARAWLAPGLAQRIAERRRHMAGPTGCGLCGIESLDAAVRPVARVSRPLTIRSADIAAAVCALTTGQVLGHQTRATHAAGIYRPGEGLVALREDVGRHNALDKLIGHAARTGLDPASGFVVLTSRVSIELVQKTAAWGASALIAMSAPTTLACSVAEAAGILLVAVAREDGFEVFTGAERVVD